MWVETGQNWRKTFHSLLYVVEFGSRQHHAYSKDFKNKAHRQHLCSSAFSKREEEQSWLETKAWHLADLGVIPCLLLTALNLGEVLLKQVKGCLKDKFCAQLAFSALSPESSICIWEVIVLGKPEIKTTQKFAVHTWLISYGSPDFDK